MTDTPGVADHASTTLPATAVEPKVTAATAAATATAVLLPLLLWLLETYVGPVPVTVQAAIGTLITGVCTFVAGYRARHVDRQPAA
jgi:hypothetical protein